jgi:transposase
MGDIPHLYVKTSLHMIDYNEFELGTRPEEVNKENNIVLGNNVTITNSNSKCNKKNLKSKDFIYRVYQVDSKKWDNCRIWDRSVNKLFERAIKYSIDNNCDISISTIDFFSREDKKKLYNIPLFTTENTLIGLELNGSRMLGNYFVLQVGNEIFV